VISIPPDRHQPLLADFEAETFALGVVLHLVAVDGAEVEVFGFGVGRAVSVHSASQNNEQNFNYSLRAYVTSVASCAMAKSDSGRIVIEVDPALKDRLHSELAASGMNMKEWFQQRAEAFLDGSDGGLLAESSAAYGMESRPDILESLERVDVDATGVASVVSLFSGCGGMDLGFQGGVRLHGRGVSGTPV